MAINKVIVIGNLGAAPMVRALPNSEQHVANFSPIATARMQARTEWLRVVAFGRLADTCERFLSKGRQVYIVCNVLKVIHAGSLF